MLVNCDLPVYSIMEQCPAFKGYQPSVLTVITAKRKEDAESVVYESFPNGLPGQGGELRVLTEPLLTSEKSKFTGFS